MARPYSEDLRWRVVSRVKAGRPVREVAATFQVSVASVVKWSQRYRETGSVAAKPMGSRMARLLIGEREWLLERIESSPDITLRELVSEPRRRRVRASYGSLRRLLRDEGIGFQEKPSRQRARSA